MALNINIKSKYYKKFYGLILNEYNKKQLWIPKGYAHGFLVLSDYAEVIYKVTSEYKENFQRSIKWNDPDLKISWPKKRNVILSNQDSNASLLKDQ